MKLRCVTGTTWKYADPSLPPSRTVWVEDPDHQVDQLFDPRQDPTLSCLKISRTSWYDHPRVWQNFVIQTLPEDLPNNSECWRILDEALAKWELRSRDRSLVFGTPEHMLMWRLAYE